MRQVLREALKDKVAPILTPEPRPARLPQAAASRSHWLWPRVKQRVQA